MGLIKAALGAAGGVLADQWKEFFYCEALPQDVLVTKGVKQQGSRSSNTKGSDNIISNGSGIAVADGQCMIIVEDGLIVEFCAEPGRFTYDTSSEPSIFCGPLGEGIKNTFKQIGKRFTYGGDTGKDQRIYYFNTKEIPNNLFGSKNPIPFRVVDSKRNFDMDLKVRCNGSYSYKSTDPMLFYKNVCGNITKDYTREEIGPQLKEEFSAALQPAFGQLSELELRPSQLMTHTKELQAALNNELSEQWGGLRGIEVVSVALASVTLPDEDQKMLNQIQRAAAINNPTIAAGVMTGAMADSLPTAAANPAGAMTGMMGVGMVGGMGGMAGGGLANMYAQGAQQQAAAPAPAPAAPAAPAPGGWTCACGAVNTGKFCTECGKAKPEDTTWTCECGAKNTGKFCTECGKPKPAGEWVCACGAKNTGKFCTECGKPRP